MWSHALRVSTEAATIVAIAVFANNLFAITKNGTAYFGGRITNANDALNIGDIIEVSGSGMRIENGELHIDFDRIRGSGNGSLTDYI